MASGGIVAGAPWPRNAAAAAAPLSCAMIDRPFRFVGRKRAPSASRVGDACLATALRLLLWSVRLLPYRVLSACLGRLMRSIGPHLSEHAVGRENLAAAFPQASVERREELLAEVWGNLGRYVADFAFLERILAGFPEHSRFVTYDDETARRFLELRDDNAGALIFAAHVGNWELPAAAAHSLGLPSLALYRPPSVAGVASVVHELRGRQMGELVAAGLHAPFALGRALEQGKHVGMLVDQHDGRGVPVSFFGRPCLANPLIAMLARRYEVPMHGIRAMRIGETRFKIELTPRVWPARDARGEFDLNATMQRIMDQIEAWVRETPGQWLWLHRRWRENDHRNHDKADQ